MNGKMKHIAAGSHFRVRQAAVRLISIGVVLTGRTTCLTLFKQLLRRAQRPVPIESPAIAARLRFQ